MFQLNDLKTWAAVPLAAAAAGCAFYSFSGSTLPGHLKTVEVPLFLNESLQPGVAEELTEKLSQKLVQADLLDIVSSKGDAVITGKVRTYENNPYTYGSSGYREVDVSEYAVKISVQVEFIDNKKEEPLYEGVLWGTGVYAYGTETEQAGRQKAIADIVEQIIQNSVQSW
jgi:hypothetical protein